MLDNIEEPLRGTIIFTILYLAIICTIDFYTDDILFTWEYGATVLLKLVIAGGLFHLLRKFFGSDSNTARPSAD
jgi:histidyl-tRNA synthetase